MYQRGTIGSYQTWADEVSDPSYTFSSLLPYFKKSVTFTPPNYSKLGPGVEIPYDPSAFGDGGPLQVSYSNFYQTVSQGAIEGFNKLDFKRIPGLNSGNLIGYAHISDTINPAAGIRSSAESSFLQEALQDVKNTLQVYKQTLATKIIFSGKRATGVQVRTDGVEYTLSAKSDVILAAGVVCYLPRSISQ